MWSQLRGHTLIGMISALGDKAPLLSQSDGSGVLTKCAVDPTLNRRRIALRELGVSGTRDSMMMRSIARTRQLLRNA